MAHLLPRRARNAPMSYSSVANFISHLSPVRSNTGHSNTLDNLWTEGEKRMKGRINFIAGLTATLLLPAAGYGQQITGQPCSTCTVSLTQVASIPQKDSTAELSGTPLISYSAGKYILGPSQDGFLLGWSSKYQKLLSPEELQRGYSQDIGILRSNANYVYSLIDTTLMRISSLTMKVEKEVALPWRPIAFTPVGDALAVLPPMSDGDDNSKIVVIGHDGKVVRSFPLARPTGSNGMYQSVYHLAPSGDTAVWVAQFASYAIDLIGLNGKVLRHMTRQLESFQNPTYSSKQPLTEPPAPRLVGTRELENGDLLILRLVADAKWKRYDPTNDRDIRNIQLNPLYDSIIDIINPATGKLVATKRFDSVLRFVYGSDSLWTSREDSQGRLFFDIFTPQIRR